MFAKIPPQISLPLFYILITTGYLYRFFFGNIYGIFALSLLVYFKCESWLGITPLNIDGLMEWIVVQSESTQATIIGSLITVIGFLIAYATATANWKSQLLAQLKIQAAGEIEVFFAECSKLATDCGIYANALVEAVNEIQKGCSNERAQFLAFYNREQGHLFLQRRERLISLGVEVHRLHGKYSTILLSVPGLKSGLDFATKALQNITNKLWIRVPFSIQDDDIPVQTFLNQINVKECLSLKSAVDENHGELGFSSGGVRGNLLSTVTGFNFWMLYYLFKDRKSLKNLLVDRYLYLQKNG